MANVIVIKKGAGVPSPDSLEQAELALDTTNGDLYTKLADDSITLLNDGADDVDLSDYVKEAPVDGKQYARKDANWSEIVIPDGGTGSSVHIGESPPLSPEEGQQWMEVPASGDAVMWIYDGGKWLQQPGGKDGAAGKDGNIADGTSDGIVATWDSTANAGTGQWTPESSLTINSLGNATFSGAVQLSRPSDNLPVGLVTLDEPSEVMDYHNLLGNGSHTFTINNVERIRIDSSGNVGIGTDSISGLSGKPTIHVDDKSGNGAIRIGNSNSAGSNFFLDHSDAGGARIRSNSTDMNIGAGPGNSVNVFTGTNGDTRLTIDDTGDATFSGTVDAKAFGRSSSGAGISFTVGGDGKPSVYPTAGANNTALEDVSIGAQTARFNNGWFKGNLYKNGSTSPVIDGLDLIKTLTTLRNATKDETTLEGLRDSIGNAIGGLIEEFENQISTMPSEDEA